jgi:hypothetical protein
VQGGPAQHPFTAGWLHAAGSADAHSGHGCTRLSLPPWAATVSRPFCA